MRPWMSLPVLLFGTLVGCAQTSPSGALLTWRMADAGPAASARVSEAEPYNGKGSLEIVTRSLPGDEAGMQSFVKVYIKRVDAKPLCTVGDLANPDTRLLINMRRDEQSGNGLPDYSMPYVSLHVRTTDARRGELVWETAYNGYPPRGGVFPEGVWVDDIAVNDGVFWMRTDRNFNVSDGFQPLSAWVDGHVTTYKEASTKPINADTEVMELEIGFGNGVPGYLRAFVDSLRLFIDDGDRYVLNFEPMATRK